MTKNEHTYSVRTVWSGAELGPAHDYRSYSRNHRIEIDGKPDIIGSSDPTFRGDASLHNPEDLLVASLSACHMLWYLHLCTANGITVHSYEDDAQGSMEEAPDGSGRFRQVTLNPKVLISPKDKKNRAEQLHQQAHAKCFIANSVNFPVAHKPTILTN